MKILLVCSAGMSTSMLVEKIKKTAKQRGMEIEVSAVSESELKDNLDHLDVVLIGPQVRYLERKVRKQVEPLGVKVDIIDSHAFGLIQGDKVLDQAIKLQSERK